MMIAKTGRTKVVLDLTYSQVNFELDLVELNPVGR